jgi:ABC-type Fe3+ transport system, permease component
MTVIKRRRPWSFKRLKNQIMQVVGNPFNMIVLVSLVLLITLVISPLFSILRTTFILAKSEVRRAGGEAGDFTLYYWNYLFFSNMSESVLWTPLIHSLTISFFTCLIAVPFGSCLAWLMIRSDLPCKKLLQYLIMIPYMIPFWCKAIAWLSIFRNKRGGAPGFLEGIGIAVPDWLAYGPVSIIFVLVLHYYAFSYIMVSSTLRSINSELEEMGEIQGAGKLQIIRKITLPLVLPAVLSAIIMTLSKALGGYGISANLGGRIGYFTMAMRQHDFVHGTSKGLGYAMSFLMVIISSGCLFANNLMTGKRKSYATIGGKGGRSVDLRLGKAKMPIMIVIVVFLSISLVMPLFILLLESFQVSPSGGYALSNLTLYNWIGELSQAPPGVNYPGIFKDSNFLISLWNTIRLTAVTALITAFMGQFFGYISTRGRGKWYGTLVDQLVFIPYLMPAIAFGAIYLGMFSVQRGPIPSLYGTFALMVLVSVVKHFPFASRTGSANMMQIGRELEEAADVAGAGFWRRIFRIVMPLSKNGFISGCMLIFISVAKELDLIALIITPKTQTMSYLAFSYSTSAQIQQSDACSIVMIAFVMTSYWIANRFFGADLSKSWG